MANAECPMNDERRPMERNLERTRFSRLGPAGARAAAAIAAAIALPVLAQNSANPVADGSAKAATAGPATAGDKPLSGAVSTMPTVPEPRQVGGEPQSLVQVANLIYAGVKSSHC